MWTEPESRPTAESSSSAYFSIVSYGMEVTSSDYLMYITAIMGLGLMYRVARCYTQREQYKVQEKLTYIYHE